MQNFCYKCGKIENENTQLLENLCPDCFKQSHPLLIFTAPLQVKLCRNCHRYLLKNRWFSSSETDIKNLLKNIIRETLPFQIKKQAETQLEFNPKIPEDFDLNRNHIEVDIEAKGHANKAIKEYIERYYDQKVEINLTMCPFCLSYGRGDYQAVLYINTISREFTDQENDLIFSLIANEIEKLAHSDALAYISKYTLKKKKITFYIGSEKFARLIASVLRYNLGGVIRETYQAGSRRISKEIKQNKLYLSLYLPQYILGDLILVENSPLYIKKIQFKHVKCINLSTHEKLKIPSKSLENIQILKHKNDMRTYLFFSQTNEIIQILDLDNYQIFELQKSPLYEKFHIGNYLKGFEVNNQILIIP